MCDITPALRSIARRVPLEYLFTWLVYVYLSEITYEIRETYEFAPQVYRKYTVKRIRMFVGSNCEFNAALEYYPK